MALYGTTHFHMAWDLISHMLRPAPAAQHSVHGSASWVFYTKQSEGPGEPSTSQHVPTCCDIGPGLGLDSVPGVAALSFVCVQLTTESHTGPPALAGAPSGSQVSEPPAQGWVLTEARGSTAALLSFQRSLHSGHPEQLEDFRAGGALGF